MKYGAVVFFLIFAGLICSCQQSPAKKLNQQDPNAKTVGNGCEDCELMYTNAPSFDELDWSDTLPGYNEPGQKMVISGIIYKADGISPAPGVILYIYHTDQSGHYSRGANQRGPSIRHGHIRGWIKTNEKGEYKFYTLKPVPYPNNKIPAHIHPIIKEPGFNEYYIDDYFFDDDPYLTKQEIELQENRGGKGIITLTEKDGILYAERNIYLGKNIPGYPK